MKVSTDGCRGSLEVVLATVAGRAGWRTAPPGKADVVWVEVPPDGVNVQAFEQLKGRQRINKFPRTGRAVAKVPLSRALRRVERLTGEILDFYPRTFVLPDEHDALETVCEANRKLKIKQTFIIKPDGASQGEGILLAQTPADLPVLASHREAIAQRYVDRPLLLEDQKKFDFRLYVLIDSLSPLRVFVCREGLARFSTSAYERPTRQNMRQHYVHLTNYSLNKKAADYIHDEDNLTADSTGSKRTLSAVLEQIRASGRDTDSFWPAVLDMVALTTAGLRPALVANYEQQFGPGSAATPRPRCFQVLGFDVLLDAQMRPFLLEVNSNPSMRIDIETEEAGRPQYSPSSLDAHIKGQVVAGALEIAAGSGSSDLYLAVPFEGAAADALAATDTLISSFQLFSGSFAGSGEISASRICRVARSLDWLDSSSFKRADLDIAVRRVCGTQKVDFELFLPLMEEVARRRGVEVLSMLAVGGGG